MKRKYVEVIINIEENVLNHLLLRATEEGITLDEFINTVLRKEE